MGGRRSPRGRGAGVGGPGVTRGGGEGGEGLERAVPSRTGAEPRRRPGDTRRRPWRGAAGGEEEATGLRSREDVSRAAAGVAGSGRRGLPDTFGERKVVV